MRLSLFIVSARNVVLALPPLYIDRSVPTRWFGGRGGLVLGAAVALLSPWGALAQPQNGVYREAYYNITGSTIASLTNASVYPNTPSYDEVLNHSSPLSSLAIQKM